MKINFLLVFSLTAVLLPTVGLARDPRTIADWYIKDFRSTIMVQNDSSLLIEERIIADCGNLPNKHGIFRILPTEIKTEKETIKTPVSLVSITDFEGNALHYAQSTNNFDHTVTWKIGDPDITVAGLNYYKITYLVKNAVRPQNAEFDEFYWNLSGNFWNIPIDSFSADLIFPDGVNKGNSQVYLYSGSLGEKGSGLASYEWVNNNTLRISSNQALAPGQGITVSVAFPKGIIAPYRPGFFEKYGDYLWFLLPLAIFIASFRIWNKYGKDPRVDKTVIPEFEIPENLTPMEMGLLAKNGSFDDRMITATIVDQAVKKNLTIEEVAKTGIFGKTDFRLKKSSSSFAPPAGPEVLIVEKIFGSKSEVLLSDLKQEFYKDLPAIKKAAIDNLKQKGLIFKSGLALKVVFLVLGFLFVGLAVVGMMAQGLWLAAAMAVSGIILLAFGLVMPKRTPKGAELNWRIKGFKLYMETAEKYRAQFYEKENIFEKFLPYAIVFGMTKLWIKKMEQIYGKEYFATYHPAWYSGAAIGDFNADSFASQIGNLSAGIISNIGTSSGAHGAGGAGGGGGGGGGGGW
jgi:uncharacterized membrane protein YgcG